MSIEIDLRDPDGDKISTSKVALEIFQNHSELPILTVDKFKDNPHRIDSLQMGEYYKILVYRNGVYASYGLITPEEDLEKVEIRLPKKARISTTVLYSDGTPAEGVTVKFKSQDGTEWKKAVTDSEGNLRRQSLQSVISDSDYYFMEIFLTEDLWFKTNPFRFHAGSQDVKITTPWPQLIDKLISIKVTSKEDLSSKPFKDLMVSFVDSKGNTNDSVVDGRGIARVSLIPPDKYTINVHKTTTSNEQGFLVASKQIILDGNQELFSIPIDLYDSNSLEVNSDNKKELVKSLVKNWYKDELDDFEFINGFQSLVKNEKIYETQQSSSKLVIPKWFKNNALWYSDEKIPTDTFINGIDFLLKNEIILMS
ncbi:MAG: hypothetical protein ACE5DL_00320 [Nitrosopumilaceae archaeon]